ncbi:Hint domain-containing protein [Rhodoblastus sp.]|jgi:hypothetical protein|uniref:Hint domain-containing protein n=1 Tax=Rhodoblastus sp. TaxID=1962975 RepID=UPI0025EF1B98|nr:Hint domain-containing protein [Rhodoblastus sp.]
MTTATWLGGAIWGGADDDSLWTGGSGPGGAPAAGNDVVLNRIGSLTLSLGANTPSLNSLTIFSDDILDVAAFTLYVDAPGSSGIDLSSGTIALAGGSIVDAADITLGAGGGISGYGSINITTGALTGAGVVEASGGLLDVFANVSSGVQLAIDSVGGGDLRIQQAAATNSAISMTNSSQILEIGSAASLTIGVQEITTGGTIYLNGGTATLTDAFGLVLGGNLTGGGTVDAELQGGGTAKASAGLTLTFKQNVDQAGAATQFVIGDGGTIDFDAMVGTFSIKPLVTFQGATGTLSDTAVIMTSVNFGTITGFSGGDEIHLQAFGAGDTYVISSDTLTIMNAAGTLSQSFAFASGTAMDQIVVTDNGGIDTIAICFMAGAMIRTPDGEAAVETLKRGDLVLTAEGAAKPVAWLGRQTISALFADPVRNWPVRIRAGALDENIPSRDLLLSPDHALLVGGALFHAGALVNGTSIRRETQVPPTWVYYHVELEDHSLILAENTPAETFVDNVERRNFDNWAEHEALYPDGKPISELPYPRAKGGRQVPPRIRALLAERAVLIGAQAGAAAA